MNISWIHTKQKIETGYINSHVMQNSHTPFVVDQIANIVCELLRKYLINQDRVIHGIENCK
jgi:hypothetical protein